MEKFRPPLPPVSPFWKIALKMIPDMYPVPVWLCPLFISSMLVLNGFIFYQNAVTAQKWHLLTREKKEIFVSLQ
jgi:hypothetical protein